MAPALTLEQLRTFVAVADAGGFSAAARRLGRVQSAVSQAVANLEDELGVRLWDRSTKKIRLTDAGRVLLASAEKVLAEAAELERLARGIDQGLEPFVALCVDSIFPLGALADVAEEFARAFPDVELRVHTETMRAVAARVLDGTCQLGIAGPTADVPGLTRSHLAYVPMVPVVSAKHPLASVRGAVTMARLKDEVQLVLSERGDDGSPDEAVLSRRTWRIADLHTKHVLLLRGLGWGNLPEHLIRAELRSKKLVRIRPAAWGKDEHRLPLTVVHPPELRAGPATRFLVQRLGQHCARELAGAG